MTQEQPPTPEQSERASHQAANDPVSARASCIRLHLTIGWWSLLVYLTLGFALEMLHGFKAGLYLDVSNSTRRLMWTLAHAHGTLLSLVHLVLASAVNLLPRWDARARSIASYCRSGASLMIPLGFFVGGVFLYAGDPGLGIVLIPPGAVLLFVAVLLTARAVKSFDCGTQSRDL
jgi:hypothetical protein